SAVLCGLEMANGSSRAALPARLVREIAATSVRYRSDGAAAAGPAGRLADAALRGYLRTPGRGAGAILLTLCAMSAAGGTGLLAPGAPLPPQPAVAEPTAAPDVARAAAPRVDRYGDALPDHVIARLGTKRFGHSFMIDQVAWSPDGRHI